MRARELRLVFTLNTYQGKQTVYFFSITAAGVTHKVAV